MARAQWAVGVLTAALLCTGLGVLRASEGAGPAVRITDDALPSRALGLSGHRRLVRQLDHSEGNGPSDGNGPAAGPRLPLTAGPLRPVSGPLDTARPLRLRIPGLGVDLPLTGRSGGARWDTTGPAPGAAGTAVITGSGLRLSALQRGRTIEILRADHRTAVFTVVRVSPGGVSGHDERAGRAQLRLVNGESTVLARLTGERHRP
ncbi:class F sortase [Streptomyces xanthophaeus]|uniref:class F sortase n=1 Tax=Streptomyces xanthophaeus TaxID=67385 RepID=UPI00342BC6CC